MTQEHRSTMRALSIFELLAFGDNSEGYTLTEIATKLRAPKSSISPDYTYAYNKSLSKI